MVGECGEGVREVISEWLQLLTPEDVAEFLEEYLSAVSEALSGRLEWYEVATVLHEGRESARAQEDQPFLAGLATWRGVTTEEEAARLTARELRERLDRALRNAGNAG